MKSTLLSSSSPSLRNTSHMIQHPHWKLCSSNLKKTKTKKQPKAEVLEIIGCHFFSLSIRIISLFGRLITLISVLRVIKPFCLLPLACKMNISSGFVQIINEFSSHISAELINKNGNTYFTVVCWLLFYYCNHRKQ